MSERVEVTTRAVNVEALKPCSEPTMKYASSARAVPASGRSPVELVQEPLDEVERGIRLDRLLAGSQPRECRQRRRRERGQRPRLLDGRRPRQVLGRAPGGDGRAQGVHRLGRGRDRAEDGHHRRRDRRGGESMARVPFARPQQVRDRGICPLRDEVADPIPAVEQASALAVDEAEAGLAGDDAFEAGRIGPSGLVRGGPGSGGGRVGHAPMVAPRLSACSWR